MPLRVAATEGLVADCLSMPTPGLGHRPGDQLLQNFLVEICEPLEVQAGLAQPVFAEFGQERRLLAARGHQVDDQLAPSHCKAGFARLAELAACQRVAIRPEAHDAGTPHLRWLACDASKERYQGLAIVKLLSRGARGEVLLDAGAAAEARSAEGDTSGRSPLAVVGSSAGLGITSGQWSAARSRRRQTSRAMQLPSSQD